MQTQKSVNLSVPKHTGIIWYSWDSIKFSWRTAHNSFQQSLAFHVHLYFTHDRKISCIYYLANLWHFFNINSSFCIFLELNCQGYDRKRETWWFKRPFHIQHQVKFPHKELNTQFIVNENNLKKDTQEHTYLWKSEAHLSVQENNYHEWRYQHASNQDYDAVFCKSQCSYNSASKKT